MIFIISIKLKNEYSVISLKFHKALARLGMLDNSSNFNIMNFYAFIIRILTVIAIFFF